MQDIHDWLRSEVADMVSQGQKGETKSDFKAQATTIWQNGINAGYTDEKIKAACGGDLEDYLLREANGSIGDRIQRGMERDKYSG